jgi:acyl-CoA synthetase (AMP-forming)/AMP-acid ligase II/thioesterase domain-containing protein/acyl carrier protein
MQEAALYSALARWADEQPEAAAILAPGQDAICFGELVRRIDSIGDQLDGAGIQRGDRVALLSPGGPETAVILLSVACRTSCIPLNPGSSAPELAAALEETRARALIAPANRDALAREAARRLEIPLLNVAWNAAGEPRCGRPRGAGPSDVALLMRTSGSTARPKRVPITHEQIVARCDKTRRLLALRETDRCLNLMPLHYMHGINSGLTAPLLAGGSVICPPSFDEETFFDCLRSLRPTWYTAGATHHLNILAWLGYREPEHALRFARSGSAPLPVSAIQELERRLGVPVVESLSSTETGTITSNPTNGRRRPGTVGISLDADVAIVDEQGRALAPGRTGEIVVRGPCVVSGYDGDPELTRAKFRDGWFHTGDLGELDAEGHLRLRGRLDDVINRGGEKISPEEVDAALLAHPAVERALTFAVSHPTLQHDVAAAVVLRAGVRTTESRLRRSLSRHLPPSKIPRRILFTQDLPMTPSGKPLRRGAADHFGLTAASTTRSTPSLLGALRVAWRRMPGSRARAGHGGASPLEQTLLACWRRVLAQEDVGVDDDFFDRGGDSVSAVRLLQMIEKDLGVTIPLQYLMEGGSARNLARQLVDATPLRRDVVAIQAQGRRRPIFAVAGRLGHVMRLVPLGRSLGEDQPFYGLQPPGLDWEAAGPSTIQEFAAHYIEQIHAIQPAGPYRLLGTSFGGLVVYEMALQLQAAGHAVELLAIVDTNPATCRIDGRLRRDERLRKIRRSRREKLRRRWLRKIRRWRERDDFGHVEPAHEVVARAHVRAREVYVMERCFQGELVYFSCGEITDSPLDRRGLWTFFATSSRVVPIPGPHGSFYLEPQLGALRRGLQEVLHRQAPVDGGAGS